MIEQAIKNRADRLSKIEFEKYNDSDDIEKKKLADFSIDPSQISKTDVVFRVMSWEHIPTDEDVKAKVIAKNEDEDGSFVLTEYDDEEVKVGKFVKINFPPFVHYKIKEDNTPYLVGKSHWRGTLDGGHFSKDHGKMTNKLANMFIKLCERYATRSNWRGYTYNDEMRSQALLQLSQIGLQFDESKSSNPFGYYTTVITNAFTRVLNIEKRNQNLRDDILELNNLNPSYTRQNMHTGSGHYEE